MPKKNDAQQKIDELTQDLQRLRADFENYRKRVEIEKQTVREFTRSETIIKLLPVIDNIDRAIAHEPAELKDNKWVQGVTALGKKLTSDLKDLGLKKIDASPGVNFDPHLHEAVMMEDSEGEKEVVAEELRPGYSLDGQVVRHSMVKVKRV